MRHAVVVEAVRTPIGRAHPEKGSFRDVRADDLSADIMKAAVERARIVPSMLEDIHWGCVRQEEEQGFDVARMAALIAGFPIEVPATTAQRNCGSSLQALHQAATSIMAKCDDIQLVGGVEHMHHLPLDSGYVPSPRYLQRHSPATLHMGMTAEFLARKYGISRREQDEFALRSHRLAGEATDRGWFASEIVPTWGRDDEGRNTLLTQDQCIRRETSLEALAALKPVFQPEGGTVTAGNASPVNVGAAAMVVMSEERASELGLKPLVRIRAMAAAGVDPSIMGVGPVPATLKALERAKLKLADIGLIEINEAFAAQTLSVVKLLGVPLEMVNVRGGAIAIGHPLGASGARIACTLIHAMRDLGIPLGVAAMCIGGGQGIATVFERVA
ncbi:MAG: acetyl-CoA C-acyltransferase [Gemmataceae bacterium]|nr:acetyl-CoA C-acyltransferase [Gemmataceae bacterium]